MQIHYAFEKYLFLNMYYFYIDNSIRQLTALNLFRIVLFEEDNFLFVDN
jgi:hypothetical protein